MVKLQKYIHSDLKKLSNYADNEIEIHSLYREFIKWKDKYRAHTTPLNLVAEKLIDDYSGLLNLLEELDPHIQKMVLSYIFSSCNEYLKVISYGKDYPGLGASSQQDKEVVNLLHRNLLHKWTILYVNFEEIFKEVQKDNYAREFIR